MLASIVIYVAFVITCAGGVSVLYAIVHLIARDSHILIAAIDRDVFDDGTSESVVAVAASRLNAECALALCASVAFVPNVGWIFTRNSLRSLKLVQKQRSDLRDNRILRMYVVLALPSMVAIVLCGAPIVVALGSPPRDDEKALRIDLSIPVEDVVLSNFLYSGFACLCCMPFINIVIWEWWAVVKRIANSNATIKYVKGEKPAKSERPTSETVPLLSFDRRQDVVVPQGIPVPPVDDDEK